MELIELEFPEGEQLDFQIALVNQMAIESDWMAFNKHQKFKVISKDRKIVSGYAMIADLPIYRNEKGREFEVVFRKESIEKIVFNFMRNGLTKNTNLDHQTGKFNDGVYVFESFMIDSQRGIKAPEGFKQEPDGSWFVSMKIENDEVWKSVLDGTYKGFSVEGLFKEGLKNNFESQLEQILKSYTK